MSVISAIPFHLRRLLLSHYGLLFAGGAGLLMARGFFERVAPARYWLPIAEGHDEPA